MSTTEIILPACLPYPALQARVRSGAVFLADGGSKLGAALAQRREALRRAHDAASGRVLTYCDAGSGAVQASRARGGRVMAASPPQPLPLLPLRRL